MLFEFKTVTDQEKADVVGLGGLHVVGTERHESRRIDNQLRGRSGRQGDPGSTRFFLSLEDSLFRCVCVARGSAVVLGLLHCQGSRAGALCVQMGGRGSGVHGFGELCFNARGLGCCG
jgi:hypothetical protein